MARKALIVRGGWEGHAPYETTELFRPELEEAGFDVTISDDLDVYLDAKTLSDADVIVQCWSMGTLTEEQCANLTAAVRAGTGFAGWHGGIVATFDNRDYLRMVGGLFLFHPPEFLTYRVRIAADHPIVDGLPDFDVTSEQYWMLTDNWNNVLATTTISPEAFEMPVAWTRKWGKGNVFFSAIGHRLADLQDPVVRELTVRGLIWASAQ